MATMERSVEVGVPIREADREMRQFSARTVIGSYGADEQEIEFRQADDCESAGTVKFSRLDPGRTRVELSVEYDATAPACAAAVEQHLESELAHYKSYTERHTRSIANPA